MSSESIYLSLKARLPEKYLLLFSVGTSLLAMAMLGYGTDRSNFYGLVVWFGLAFLAYFLQIRSKLSLAQGLGLGLALRVIFIGALPALSDDYFRFLWDGYLINSGQNPFLTLPSQWMEAGAVLPEGISPALFQKLNSPAYYSIYPPVCQIAFWFCTWVGEQVQASVIVLRVLVLAAEAGTLWLLPKLLIRLQVPPRQALWYALNPAVVLELTGNLHPEAFMIFFLAGSFLLLTRQKWIGSAVLLGLSVASKLVPLLLIPLLPGVLGWRKAVMYGIFSAITVLLLFAPFVNTELLAHLGSSLTLYFQKFEFNASLYYLLRALGFWLVGYNTISLLGLVLSALVLVSALWWGFRAKPNAQSYTWFIQSALALFTVYFLCATVVHPWYLSTLVFLASGTRFRYPMVWSGLAVLSYAAYQTAAYQENLYLVAFEYMVVLAVLFWELKPAVLRPFSGKQA